jgi:Ca-activated chloride channel family protein
MSHYSFEFPYAFLLLVLFWFCFKKCPAKSLAIYLPYIHLFISNKKVKSRWSDIFKWLGLIAFVTALASPVKVEIYNNIKKEARDIMLVIDSSKSMLDRGFDENNPKLDKFSVVRDVVSKFIKDRKGDRIGLINFSSSAFVASPLTFDKSYLEYIISKQRVGLVGSRTAIYDALLQAIYILEKSEAKTKIAILLTDGIDNMSVTKFREIKEAVKKSKVKLYIIGIGSIDDLDVPKLKELASAGRGKFYLATSSSLLENIYKKIDKSETTKIKGESYKQYTYYYYFPLIFAIIFLLLFVYYKSIKGVAK